MPAGTAFSTTVDDTSYQFVTIADITSSNNGGSVPFDSVKIYEGTYVTTKFLVNTSDVDAGTTLYWSLSGTNISLSDFSDGSLKGSGTVGNEGTFSFKHLIANDGFTEGYETIDIKLFSDSSLTTQIGDTKSILIRDSAKTEQITS